MRLIFYTFCIIICFLPFIANSQKNATITGKIIDEEHKLLAGASITLLGKNMSTVSNDSGFFSLKIPSNKVISLLFSYTGYIKVQKNIILNSGETEFITIRLKKDTTTLTAVEVKDDRKKREPGSVQIDPSKAGVNPSPIQGIEQLIKIFVGSNNELTSQYSVRGGSYDENLIYVNDFEVFRPYLIRNGQQEGLSFINPELTSGIKFYNGGFQTKYGDKMSSVLDITYKKPKKFGGSIYIGLLEQGLHLEGVTAKNKISYLIGVRNRSNRNLLSSQDTKGNYVPASSDIQALLNYTIHTKWNIEFFGNMSTSKFTLTPEESKLSSSVFSPFYTANFGLDIYFDGKEKDSYSTNFMGISVTHQPNKNSKLKWFLSRFNNNEKENIDITGAYLFGDRDFDKGSSSYGLISNPLGAGVFQNYARNTLNISVWDAGHKGSMDKGKHFLQWGGNIQKQYVDDKLNEWEYNDSAGYALPYTGSLLQLNKVLKGKANFNVTRITGYIQDNIQFKDSSDFIMQLGLRFNYNSLNKEFLLSPRVSFSFIPKYKKDLVVKGAIGAYHQPAFYREMRRYDGSLNKNVKAQKSIQASLGLDYNFTLFQRPARVTTEAYYKNMWDVVPYDIDNVRVRYFGENMAKAYAFGLETRLYGELVKDAESWISFGIMKTKENINNDAYQQYTLDNNNVPIDSTLIQVGWLRRPTDRFITFGMFFQDYLSTNKNFKFYMNALYGSNLPYNIPGSVRYRNALRIEPYIRVDIGLSALLLQPEKQNRRSYSPFKNFESIWISLEAFNLIDRANTISYLLIKDYQNNTFAMPNRLTPRLINFKLIAKW
jgi:Holliday junction resolvase-like predicted endonuclease